MSHTSDQPKPTPAADEAKQITEENLESVSGGVTEGGCIPDPMPPFLQIPTVQ
jgi:hypothetical protein